MLQLFRDAYGNRELIWTLALTELKLRYKRSALGFLWALFNPLLLMIVMTLVFSTLMRLSIKNYAIFLFSALLPWTFFSQSLTYAVESIVGNGALLKKVRIANSIFPVAAVLSNLINFLLSLVPLSLMLLPLKFPFHWTWLYLPVPLLTIILFALGCAFFCAAANVFFRDVTHIIQIVLSTWFYFSPVIYPWDIVPARYQWLFRLNPMLYILNGFRLAIYQGALPSAESIAISLACAIGTLVVGFGFFSRYQSSFVFYV